MKLETNFNIICDENRYEKLISYLGNLNFKRIFIIVDKRLQNLNHTKKIITFLKKKLKKNEIFYYFENHEPTYQYLEQKRNLLKKNKKIKFDCILSIGGGSTIDFSKGLALLTTNSGKAVSYRGFPINLKKPVPIVAIPTTTSSGSEIIYNAVFTDIKLKKKLGINTKLNYPILSIYDPKFISLAPKIIIYYSACASLMRSIDASISKSRNLITDYFAEKSFDLIVRNLPDVMKNKNNLEACLNLQLAGLFSMVALSNTGGGPAGILTYFLSSNFSIPQAKSFSIVGFEIIRKNIQLKFKNYKNILKNQKQPLQKFEKYIYQLEKIIPKNGSNKIRKKLEINSALKKFVLEKKDLINSRNLINFDNKDLISLSDKISYKLKNF